MTHFEKPGIPLLVTIASSEHDFILTGKTVLHYIRRSEVGTAKRHATVHTGIYLPLL